MEQLYTDSDNGNPARWVKANPCKSDIHSQCLVGLVTLAEIRIPAELCKHSLVKQGHGWAWN